MKALHFFAAGLAATTAVLAAAPRQASVVGRSLSDIELEGLTQTKAESMDEYAGRALLLEFFAYW